MNTRHNPPASPEPLTPEERAWSERLALIGPHDGPPSALDTKILAAAHAAVAQRPHRRSQRLRWPTLVGAAASLVIVVGLAWQLQPLLRSRPSLGEGPPAASAPMASSEGSLSDDVLAAADPVAQSAVKSPPPPPEPAKANKSVRPQEVANAPRAPTPTPRSSTSQPRDFGDDAIPPYTDYAGMAARQAASQVAADAAEAMAMPAPPPSMAPAPSAANGAAAPARDASARKAAAPLPEAQSEQDSPSLDRVEVTGSRIRSADLPVRDDTRLEPAAWLQRIRDRRDADDLDGARESLVLFRQTHPRVRLPADIAQLGR